MKGQKVYVVTEESAVDGEIIVRVFAERKEAQEYFNQVVQEWKDDVEDVWEESEERDGCYEAWLDGSYNSDHVTIYLDEKEVE